MTARRHKESGRPILLTGFRPFGKVEVNPTQRLMERIAASADPFPGVNVRTAVLDVDYHRCEEQFRRAVADEPPAAILSFGLHQGVDDLRLERVAVNVDEAAIPDTGGCLRSGQRIVEDGPVGYWSTLPLEQMYGALREAGLPVVWSNHAGTYLCNHFFYYARHWIETHGLDIAMGFVHVPPLPEQLPAGDTGRKGMALEVLFRAAEVCARVVAGSR